MYASFIVICVFHFTLLILIPYEVKGAHNIWASGHMWVCPLMAQAYGIIGCVRFLDSYYLLLVTKREHRGSICSHKVYCVADTALIPLLQPSGPVRSQNSFDQWTRATPSQKNARHF
jgi:hypothetical protein